LDDFKDTVHQASGAVEKAGTSIFGVAVTEPAITMAIRSGGMAK